MTPSPTSLPPPRPPPDSRRPPSRPPPFSQHRPPKPSSTQTHPKQAPAKSHGPATHSSPTPGWGPSIPHRSILLRSVKTAVKVIAAIWVIREYFFEISSPYGPSMYPTIGNSGEVLLISKWYRRGRDVQVGDVVISKHMWFSHLRTAKRVTGLPGDFVAKEQEYVDEKQHGEDPQVEGMVQVPEGHFWFVGDNLPYSRDSRTHGPAPLAMITGKAVFRMFPPSRAGFLRDGLRPVQESSSTE